MDDIFTQQQELVQRMETLFPICVRVDAERIEDVLDLDEHVTKVLGKKAFDNGLLDEDACWLRYFGDVRTKTEAEMMVVLLAMPSSLNTVCVISRS